MSSSPMILLSRHRTVNCSCKDFMPLLHHASLRLNFTTSPVKFNYFQACFMVSYNRIGIHVVPSYEEVVVCLDLLFCHTSVFVNEKSH